MTKQTGAAQRRLRVTARIGVCVRCGKSPIAGATYCRTCHGWSESIQALLRTAPVDAALLERAQSDSLATIARDENVTRQAVHRRIAKARERQRRRDSLGVSPGV